VCDHALLIGYADQTRHIGRELVERAIKYLEEGELPSRQRRVMVWKRNIPFGWAAGTVGAATVGVLAVAALGSDMWASWWHSVVDSIFDFARAARQLMGG
jgi:hypothetical protein